MKKIFYALAFSMILLPGCSNGNSGLVEASEIEAAIREGKEAGRTLVNRKWNDTIQLQRHILEAKAKQSKYLIDKKEPCAAAFDSAFISTVRAVRPDLAKDIFRNDDKK